MITTTENIEAERCQCCNEPLMPDESRWNRGSYPSVLGGRICSDCENQFSRKPFKIACETDLEKDYAAFLKGKRDYGIKVQITCADGSEILSPVSDRMAKAFLRG